ncbi:MAG: hypothetical protein Q8M57_07380 [Nitrosomonas sp.]|uniref:hypothetical protein n=1 Tax=Nitrosomonas sp. TaxID=42353 RepID=UPI0027320C04|nr:hypothetical protein [Nitrosomonas sp.]MDP2225737.1 hypothetical protein [Nitrosomonas sp.]MDP3280852.1 hypothetical protein [Nitrosomonas sp.]
MCGYCYEGIMLHVVETGQRYTKGYRFSYLQESNDIKTEIQQLEDPNIPEPLIDLAFCRLYDHYFTHGFDVELFNILQEKFGHEAVQAYLTRRQASSSAFKAELGNINLLSDKACWNQFIADKERILKNALDMLNFYHDWWLLGIGKEKSEPKEQIEEFGILDHIDNTTLAEWNKFDALYPAISFALSYIINHDRDAEIIQKIALTNLEDAPDMWGKDLWLQRRAMLACVQRSGLAFIVDNLNKIRYELIYYVLLKADANPIELNQLRKAVLSEDEHPMWGMMESDHIIGLIDRSVYQET